MVQETGVIKAFFSERENMEVLLSFQDQLKIISHYDRPTPDIIAPLQTVISSMIRSRGLFDKNCQINIDWIGERFISRISSFSSAESTERRSLLFSIFEMSYRFVKELEFSLPDDKELGADLSVVRGFVQSNISSFSESDFSDVVYAEYLMPSYVLKKLVNDPSLAEIKEFNNKFDQVKQAKLDWDAELDKRQSRLDALEDYSKRLTVKYNFVGITKGFQDLLIQKNKEKRFVHFSLIFVALSMTAMLFCELSFVVINIDEIDLHKETLIYTLPAVIAIQILLFYFFRVILSNHNSLKAQILQLDLRVSVCQFIQSYTEYSSEIKKADQSAFEKFEQLIFSGLVATDADIPSTFDGVEQIAKLVASIKSPP